MRPASASTPASTPWGDAWRRFLTHRLAVVCLGFLILTALACVAGPWFSHYAFADQDLALGATPPSSAHWLGTDALGRDELVRLLIGGRVSLSVGLLATSIVLLIGVSYGMVAGYTGGWLDRVMMRIVDILYALPYSVFIILLMVLLSEPLQTALTKMGRANWTPYAQLALLFLAIGAFEWLNMARVVRARTLELKSLPFIEAARALGRRPSQILRLHLLPNLAGLIVVYATLCIPSVVLLESFISYLGLGVQPPLTSWGDLIKQGADNMEEYPWLLLYPSILFSLTLFALNFVGDGLRDALDPRADKAK